MDFVITDKRYAIQDVTIGRDHRLIRDKAGFVLKRTYEDFAKKLKGTKELLWKAYTISKKNRGALNRDTKYRKQ